MAVQRVVNDPLIAYGSLNIMLTASVLSAVPIWLTGKAKFDGRWSLLVVLLVLTSPYMAADGAAYVGSGRYRGLWWYLWSWRGDGTADLGHAMTCVVPVRRADGRKVVVLLLGLACLAAWHGARIGAARESG